MPLLLPATDSLPQREALSRPDSWLVACFCAAWCDTCQQYRARFEALARERPDLVFAWIDIEDHPELLGDEDVENFPTLLVQVGGQTRFYGTMLPHIAHLERLLDSLAEGGERHIDTTLPDLTRLLSRNGSPA